MIEGKYSYDNIDITDKLDTVFATSCLKARRRLRTERVKRYGITAAAFLCVFLLSNNDAVYAKASGIPVIGTLVSLLHIGEGGAITDGVKGQFTAAGNTLTVSFAASENIEAPHYQISYSTMPRRVTLALNGVREFDRDNFMDLAAQCNGVKDIYSLIVLDDSQMRFAIELEDGIGYQVKEYQNPASLELVFATEYYQPDVNREETWTVRIPSMENGEPLAMVQELYAGKTMDLENVMIESDSLQAVKTQSGLYTVTAGTYGTEEDAKKAADYLNQSQFSDEIWYPEQNSINERPQ